VSQIISRLQSGLIYNYAFSIFIFLTFFIFLITFSLDSTPFASLNLLDLIILLPIIFTAGFYVPAKSNAV